MGGYSLLLISFLMICYGIYHWPEEIKKRESKEVIIDVKWEECDPENKKD